MSAPTPPPDDRPTENVAAQSAAPPPPPARRRPRWLLGGAIAAALLVLGGVVVALLAHDGPGRHQPDRDAAGPGLAAGEGRYAAEDLGGRDLLGEGRGGRRGLGADTLLVGTVAAVDNGTLTVDRDGGGRTTVRTDDRTRLRDGGTGPADLRAGDRVVVRVRGTGATAAAVGVSTPRAHVTGTVTALDQDRATVVGVAGLTATVDVSGLTTRPAVGDLVTLTGTSADGGATLRAETLRPLPKTG